MLGAYFCWLQFECNGDPELHSEQYCDANLPRHSRKAFRIEALASHEFGPLFMKERLPLDDESDGEPQAVAGGG